MELGGWRIVEVMLGETPMERHVVPVDDFGDHVFKNCACRPECVQDEPFVIMKHNSFDGREEFETGVRKLS